MKKITVVIAMILSALFMVMASGCSLLAELGIGATGIQKFGKALGKGEIVVEDFAHTESNSWKAVPKGDTPGYKQTMSIVTSANAVDTFSSSVYLTPNFPSAESVGFVNQTLYITDTQHFEGHRLVFGWRVQEADDAPDYSTEINKGFISYVFEVTPWKSTKWDYDKTMTYRVELRNIDMTPFTSSAEDAEEYFTAEGLAQYLVANSDVDGEAYLPLIATELNQLLAHMNECAAIADYDLKKV